MISPPEELSSYAAAGLSRMLRSEATSLLATTEESWVEGVGGVLHDVHCGELGMLGVQEYVLVTNNDSGRNSQNEGSLALGPMGSDIGKFARRGIRRPIFRKGRGFDGACRRGVWDFDGHEPEVRRLEDGVDVDEEFYGGERRAARRVHDRSAFPVPAPSMRPGARTAEVVCVDILCNAIDDQR